jgi:hypothetical protein
LSYDCRVGALGRSLLLLSSCIALGACGTLLSLDEDPPSPPTPVQEAGRSDGGAADATMGGSEASIAEAAADAPFAQQFLTTFDPPNNVAPYGFQSIFSTGAGMGTVQDRVYVSKPNGFLLTGGSYFLKRILDAGSSDVSIKLALQMESFPLNMGASTVDLVAVSCGEGAPPFGRVHFTPTGTVTIADGDSKAATGETALTVGVWYTLLFELKRVGTDYNLSLGIDSKQPQPLAVVTTCASKIELRVGISYRTPQVEPTSAADSYTFDLDNVAVDVTF